MRRPDIEKFELARIQALSATPWSLHEPVASQGGFVDKTVIAPEVPESTMKVRTLYILPKDLEMFGYSPGCNKCQSYAKGTNLSSTVQHSEACGQRVMIQLAKTEVGRARIAKETERTDHYLADRVAEGDQRTAQGGIVRAVEAPPISQLSENFAFIPIVKSASDNESFVERVVETPARVPTEPSTNAAVAGSSNDEKAEDIAIDEAVDIGGASGAMDLDVVESNIVEGMTLASGRKYNRLFGQLWTLTVSGTGSVRAGRH